MNQLPKISHAVLLIAVASLFFGIAITSIAFVLVSICTIFLIIGATKAKSFNKEIPNGQFLLIILFGYITIREAMLGLDNGMDLALKYLPFLVFPIFASLMTINQDIKKNLATVYIFSAFINSTVNISYAVYRGFILPEKINQWYFSYDFLAEPFGIQPIYLALFYVLAIFFVADRLKKHWVYWLIIIFLFINLFLLSARNALISLLILLPIYLIIKVKISKQTFFGIALILTVSCIVALQSPVVKNRVFRATKERNLFSGTSLRYNIWSSALDASEKNIVFGSGKYNGRALLVEEFKKRELKTPTKYEYHAHNQFLAFLIEYGIVGVLILVFLFFQLGYNFIKNGEILGFFWLIMVFFACITESILTRQWGIIFFALFASCFWDISKVNTQKSLTNKD